MNDVEAGRWALRCLGGNSSSLVASALGCQTMAREWAYGLTYRSHRHRNQALPHWLEHYNTRRPYSGIGDRPPISRVHNLCGQDS